MAFSKEKTVTVTAEDFLSGDTLYHAEFEGSGGGQCLITVEYDPYCENPRQDGEPLWTWVTTRGAGYSDKMCETPDDYKDDDGRFYNDFLRENIIVSLSLYRHSGDHISIGKVHPILCRFDSGCMGFAYVSRQKALGVSGGKRLTKKRRELIMRILQGEVDAMNAYNEGSVYGIRVMNMETEEEDTCWGFICPERGDLKTSCIDMLYGWVEPGKRQEIADRLVA